MAFRDPVKVITPRVLWRHEGDPPPPPPPLPPPPPRPEPSLPPGASPGPGTHRDGPGRSDRGPLRSGRLSRSHPVDAVEVRQTHISVVFLAGPHAYKIKKPVDLGFLDFSTPERRRHFCEQEVRLNRRLAPSVYLGVVPVTFDGTRVEVEGRRRGRRVGREDGAPARRRHAPRAAPTRGDRRRAGRGPGPPHRRVPRPRRGRRVDLGLRPLRGGGPQRPRELRGVGVPRGHDDQPGRVRAAARR